ncbi:MAG: DUF481 domain-containing protein [Kiritimatiellae bacterium]|nr:DUF481 domain-containing protein [Kiritimatiellia bacterium]
MKSIFAKTIVLLVIGMGSLITPVQAIINMEDQRIAEPADGVSGYLRPNISGMQGNVEQEGWGVSAKLDLYKDGITYFIVTDVQDNETFGNKTADSLTTHLRNIRQWTPKVAWEGFVQYERDNVKRLNKRVLVGTDGRFTLAKEENKIESYLGVGAFYFDEKLDGDEDDDGVRISTYFTYKHNINENLSVANTLYFQPKVDDMADLRILNHLTMQVKMTASMSLTSGLDFLHESEPAFGVEETDWIYRSGIQYNF